MAPTARAGAQSGRFLQLDSTVVDLATTPTARRRRHAVYLELFRRLEAMQRTGDVVPAVHAIADELIDDDTRDARAIVDRAIARLLDSAGAP